MLKLPYQGRKLVGAQPIGLIVKYSRPARIVDAIDGPNLIHLHSSVNSR